MAPKASFYGLVIVGSVLTLHFGSAFLKPFVTVDSSAKTHRTSEEQFIENLKMANQK